MWYLILTLLPQNPGKPASSSAYYNEQKLCVHHKLVLSEKPITLYSCLWKNNYPDWLVEKEKEKFLKGDSKDVTSKEQKSDKDFNCVLVFPFIGKESVKLGKEIKRIFSEAFPRFDVLIAYRNFKMGTYFGLKAPALFSSNLVYDFRCSEDGEVSYIGTTTRHLWKRIEEHLDPKKYSAIQAHLAECDKCCGWRIYPTWWKCGNVAFRRGKLK